MSFAEIMIKNISNNISKNLSGKCRQKLVGHIKKSPTDALKTTLRRVIQKKAEAASNLIGNKIVNKITKNSPQNSFETSYIIIKNKKLKKNKKFVRPNQLSKFKIKNWVEINDDARGIYNTNRQNKFKKAMLNSGWCDYSDRYIHVKETISQTLQPQTLMQIKQV